MNSVELAVKGRIVTEDEIIQGTILIRDGRILGLSSVTSSVESETELDCGHYFILPGIVDSHVHFRDPGLTHKEDFETGSLAAAAGGVTTVSDMPNTSPWVVDAQTFIAKRTQLQGKSSVDFTLEAAIEKSATVPALEKLAEAGASSFEAFSADVPREYLLDDDFSVLDALKKVNQVRSILGVYCESQSLWENLVPSLKSLGEDDLSSFSKAKPPISEIQTVNRILTLNQFVNARILLRQISTGHSAHLADSYRRQGQKIHVETTPHHLILRENEVKQLGCISKISPPIRGSKDVDELWTALNSGKIDIISSDHSPHTLEEKTEKGIWDCPAGFPGVETSLPLMLDQVSRGRVDLNHLALLMSTNPAKVLRIYPTKGALIPGSQADLTVVDLRSEWTIRGENLHSKSKWTPFEGRTIKGLVRYTILSGKVIAKDMQPVLLRQGKFIPVKR